MHRQLARRRALRPLSSEALEAAGLQGAISSVGRRLPFSPLPPRSDAAGDAALAGGVPARGAALVSGLEAEAPATSVLGVPVAQPALPRATTAGQPRSTPAPPSCRRAAGSLSSTRARAASCLCWTSRTARGGPWSSCARGAWAVCGPAQVEAAAWVGRHFATAPHSGAMSRQAAGVATQPTRVPAVCAARRLQEQQQQCSWPPMRSRCAFGFPTLPLQAGAGVQRRQRRARQVAGQYAVH